MRVVEAAALVAALVAVLSVGPCESNKEGGVGSQSACETGLKTLQTAEEAYYAANNTYGTYAQLITAGFVTDSGTNVLHTVTLSSDGMSYTLTPTDKSDCNDNYPERTSADLARGVRPWARGRQVPEATQR